MTTAAIILVSVVACLWVAYRVAVGAARAFMVMIGWAKEEDDEQA